MCYKRRSKVLHEQQTLIDKGLEGYLKENYLEILPTPRLVNRNPAKARPARCREVAGYFRK